MYYRDKYLAPCYSRFFVNDIEDYLRTRNLTGLSINSHEELMLLAYADDMVILGDSAAADVNKKLKCLQSYCAENALVVNESKTKVLVFQRGRLKKKSFYYMNKPIETVNKILT